MDAAEGSSLARVVIVTRKSPLELLIEKLGTRTQAEFYLSTRGQNIADYEASHASFTTALDDVSRQLPVVRRRVRVDRAQLDRFMFAPDDIVVFVGQDGLVANAAKYLRGQLAIGVNPDPARYDGILVPHPPAALTSLLAFADAGAHRSGYHIEERTMVEGAREDGQVILALNEIYVGHRTHQSSRYRVRFHDKAERHSSSGVIISTGTGASGWTRSISAPLRDPPPLPAPEDPALVFFVREAWPSVATGTDITKGIIAGSETLILESDLPEDGIAFGDGIESDAVEFLSGHRITLRVSEVKLRLVKPPLPAQPDIDDRR